RSCRTGPRPCRTAALRSWRGSSSARAAGTEPRCACRRFRPGARGCQPEAWSSASVTRSLGFTALVLAMALVVFEARVAVGGQTWDDLGYHTEVAPPRLAAADQMMSGRWRAWGDGASFGVPLAAEPSHGAAYPAMWLALGPHGLDFVMLVHLWWLALGVAAWARQLSRQPASALVAGLFALGASVFVLAGLR